MSGNDAKTKTNQQKHREAMERIKKKNKLSGKNSTF